MQPIQINVQVNIGLDSGLFTLISSVLNRPAQLAELPAATAETKETGKAAAETGSREPAGRSTGAEPEQTRQPEPAPEPAEPVEPQPAPAQTQEVPKEYTEVDVRAAIDRARKRIEGEDYKENPDSEGHRKWHRTLTDWFKNVSMVFGADKPSSLPDSESRRRFIEISDAVYVKDDELVTDCPF